MVAWPQGIWNSWNAGACWGKASSQKVDEVGFARAVAAYIQSGYAIDRSHMYVTGLSNGCDMTQRLEAEAGDFFAAGAGRRSGFRIGR